MEPRKENKNKIQTKNFNGSWKSKFVNTVKGKQSQGY
jgi:hypothetical protein